MGGRTDGSPGEGEGHQEETAGENDEIRAEYGEEEKYARRDPDSPGDSPALLASTVIFYWVYDVINLIARPAHGPLIVTHLNRWTFGDAARVYLPLPCHLGNFRSRRRAP